MQDPSQSTQPTSPPTPQEEAKSNEAQAPELRLGDLFQKDPNLLTDEEIDKIVAELRANRIRWQQEEAQAATEERKPKRSAGVNIKSLDLKDLGL